MLAITTTTRGLFVTYCHCKVMVSTVSYQYFLICIIVRYTYVNIFAGIVIFSTNILLYFLCLFLYYHGMFLFLQISNLYLSGMFELRYYAADKEIDKFCYLIISNIGSWYRNQASTEIHSTAEGRIIVVREILT